MGRLKTLVVAMAAAGITGFSFGAPVEDSFPNELTPSDPVASIPTGSFADSRVHVTPSGSYLFIGNNTLFMPGVQLDRSILHALLRAGGDTLYSKIVHHLMHMAMRQAHDYFDASQFISYMQIGIPLTYNLYYYFYQLPKFITLAEQGIERAQTMVGWRRRGRMPVFLNQDLDKAAFVDYLVQTQEALDGQYWQLEIAPLTQPSLSDTASPWEKTFASLLETALDNQIDLIRIGVDDEGAMELSWHNNNSNEWLQSNLYDKPENGQFMSQWLESSWSNRSPEQLYSSLDTTTLTCIEARMTGDATPCQLPLSLITENADDMTYRMASDSAYEPSYIQVHNNPHWYIWGEPGYLSAGKNVGIQRRAESHQYRMSRSMATLAEYMMNITLRRLTDATLGASVEKLIDIWKQKPSYQHVKYLTGQHVSSGIQQVRDENGKIWIRKEAPVTGIRSLISTQYAAMANEVLILEEIDHPNVIKVKDHWLENAGSHNAKMVTILEAGESDLLHHNFQSAAEMKSVYRDALQGIQATHQAGFAHNDIKPDNFIRMADGTVKLIDFGAATRMDANGRAPMILSTPDYVSPNHGDGGSKENDIWALGISNLTTLLSGNGELSFWERVQEGRYPGSRLLPKESDDFKAIAPLMPSLFMPNEHKSRIGDLISTGNVLQGIPNYADFVGRMLKFAPADRDTTDQLLKHPFLRRSGK